jgi:hypothetical protein
MTEIRRVYHLDRFSLDAINYILQQIADRLDEIEGLRGLPSYVAEALYPVGALIITTVAANPATYLGFGTWTSFEPGITPTPSIGTLYGWKRTA